MRRYSLFQLLFLTTCLEIAGCGQAPVGTPTAQGPTTPATPSNSPTPTPTPTPTQPAPAATPPAPPQAEVTAADLAPPPQAPVKMEVAEPTTAAAALRVINLETFPKLKVKREFEAQPTMVYYTTEGTITGADALLAKELANAGWKEAKHLVTSTDQYVDRLLSKDGYFMRVTISTGGTQGELAINLTLLGNFDVRTLPQTADAEAQESTPVMAGHRSSLSIPDAYDNLKGRMLDAGWQIVEEFHKPMDEVPHYRSLRFRKNAVRVNLGFVKDPTKPAEKISILYHAESVLPIDLPMIDSRQPIKYDLVENRARMPWKEDRAALVELLTKHASDFNWQLLNADDYLNKKTVTLYISLGTPIGIATHIVESAGAYYVTMDRVKLPTKKTSDTETPNQVAQTQPADDAAAKKMKSDIEAQIAETDSVINKAINDELTKALGSLSSGGSKPDMQALLKLQAQAAKLEAELDKDEPSESAPKKPVKPVDVMNVPDDAEPLRAEDQNIKATEARVKHGESNVVLKHCLTYARMEDGTPAKILLFSDKPLMADKLDKLCASGDSFSIYEGFGSDRPNASLELHISGDNVMMNFAMDGYSMSTNSSDLKSTVRFKGGKLQGRVTLDKPMELGGKALTFEATVADKVRR